MSIPEGKGRESRKRGSQIVCGKSIRLEAFDRPRFFFLFASCDLDAVCKAKGVLVVYSLSRLARSTKDTIQIGERLNKASADLVSLSELIDTTSAAGKMMFRMLAVLAEFERDRISERTATAMKFNAAQGQRVGKVPFGFDLASDGVTLVSITKEQDAISISRGLRATGLSLRNIADELNRQQIKTKEGKPWVHTTVQRIVTRPA